MMAYFFSVSDTKPRLSRELLEQIRKKTASSEETLLDLTKCCNFTSTGLNSVWSFAQGWQYKGKSDECQMHEDWSKQHDNVCSICRKPRTPYPEDALWVGFMSEARCRNCYDYRWRTGNERPPEAVQRLQIMHQQQSRELLETECGNCRQPSPENPRKNGWRGFGPDLRCHRCWTYKNEHENKERSQKLWDRRKHTFKEHQAWIALGNEDKCYNCGEPRPEDWRGP